MSEEQEKKDDNWLYSTPGGYINVGKADNFGTPYYYAARKGNDSVAFVLYDRKKIKQFGLINEYKPPINRFLLTAFGGSLDDPKERLEDCVRREVAEESGYLDCTQCDYLGEVFVSTQMNQMCHLFMVDVTDKIPGIRNPQDEAERQARVEWITLEEAFELKDWKALTIIAKSSK